MNNEATGRIEHQSKDGQWCYCARIHGGRCGLGQDAPHASSTADKEAILEEQTGGPLGGYSAGSVSRSSFCEVCDAPNPSAVFHDGGAVCESCFVREACVECRSLAGECECAAGPTRAADNDEEPFEPRGSSEVPADPFLPNGFTPNSASGWGEGL